MSSVGTENDYVDTNLLNSENKGLLITQDIVGSVVISSLVEDSAKGVIYNLGGKQALQKGLGRYDAKFTKEMFERLQKTSAKKVQGNITKRMGQLFAKKTANTVLKSLGKSAGTAAARSGAVTAGGCTLGPAGCAAGAAIGGIIFIADLAFTIFNTIIDIQDKEGILNVFHKEYIDNIINDYETALREGYADMGYPDAFDEEILFYPEDFVYDYNPFSGFSMDPDNKWAQKYTEYENEYLKSIGIEDGWEERLETKSLQIPDIGLPPLPGDKSDRLIYVSSSLSCFLCLFLFSVLMVV